MVKKTTTKKDAAGNKLPVVVMGNKKNESMDVPAFFAATVSPQVIAQTILVQRKRARVRRAHTKERAEVRGGGRKPWKQKGTGRSRHGSIRSPLWVGGGTTFGPRSRHEYIGSVPIKERRAALAGVFAEHVNAGTLSIIRFGKDVPKKTKEAAAVIGDVHGLLIVVDDTHRDFRFAAKNISGVTIIDASVVIPRDIAQANFVWVDETALPGLEKRCTFSTHMVTA